MISPEVLRRYPYFAAISEESLREIAMIAEEVTFAVGKVIFREGDAASYLSIVRCGEIDIQYTLGNGEMRTVDTLVGGDLLGWSALVEPHHMTATATASQPTDLVRIEAAKLRKICDNDPLLGYRLAMQVAKLLAARLEGARVQLAAV